MIVRVQYSPDCPKCDKLLEELFVAGIQYGFEVLPEMVDTTLETTYLKDEASKIYDTQWIEKHGTPKQKQLAKEAGMLIDMIGKTSNVTPVIEIRWYHGRGERSIVIKGFSKDTSDKGIKNLVRAILSLLNLERRVG